MAVIPTFSSYAQTPNLAQAYLGGQEIQVARERIAQQAAEAASRIALGRQQLQAEQVANEMEWSAKKDIAARQALQQAQEFEIEKAYRQTQLGLSQRNLEQQDLSLQLKLAEAAQDFAAQQAWERDYPRLVTEGINAGKTKEEAERDAARSLMLQRGGLGVATAVNPPSAPRERLYEATVGINRMNRQPITVRMTAPEFQSFLPTASPEIRTNAANVAIQGMLQPPTSITGTNAPGGTTNALKILRRRVSNANL